MENEKGSGEFDEEKPILSAVISGWNSFIDRLPWWAGSVTTVAILGAFTLYSIYIVFFEPVADYEGYLLSPMYSPPVPSPWDWLSPAILVLWIPLGFRLTCYYYRKAYYRAFFWDPPACQAGAQEKEPRKVENYRGERAVFVLNNVHRYFLYASFVVLAFLWYDTVLTFFPGGSFGIKVGSIIWLANVVLLSTYSLSCHSLRHIIGGNKDCYTCVRGGNARLKLYNGVSRLNLKHPQWAWYSLFSVLLTDIYFRLIQAGVIPDLTILG